MLERKDPRIEIANRPMSRLQIFVIFLCIALNAMDGFDVLAISFAAPGIADEWGINKTVLGIVLSMELIGMAIGSIVLGNIADKLGRRPVILVCLLMMAIGMFLSAAANSVLFLSIVRLVTGFGIGGMLSSTSAMVAEYSNEKRRSLATILNIAGYAMGAIIGGVIATKLLAISGDWRSVFIFGGAVTAVLLPVVALFLPESIHSQLARRPPNTLAKINKTLVRMKWKPVEDLVEPDPRIDRPSILALFSKRYIVVTCTLTVAYFAQIMAFYFIQKWTPKIVVDLGFDPASAGQVLVFANVGSLTGAIVLGLISSKVNLKFAVIVSMISAFVCFGLFGMGHSSLMGLSIFAAATVCFTNAGVVGMYPILAQSFPASLRASGTGFVIGLGRGGAALGPIIAGSLFQAGNSLQVVSLVMGSGALLAALMIFTLFRRKPEN
ncbi:MFS transporter [Hirschia baltica]|uniref:Major facilitator superfamily MFS_1 n=1 Tax=Hirschia baltica (strain ATCC 49814 / DSM 5838 / IFAM 1418) TaxID=582402 RepID=C6XP65_HIRBI|nr:MFS transporter [Hirschia baltica]ACT60245.1 major facilitator superfamily MFS_1 [Hirschia baltica ATCC 49814]